MINFLQKSEDWDNTEFVIAYDDSDSWYDHQMGKFFSHSFYNFLIALKYTRPIFGLRARVCLAGTLLADSQRSTRCSKHSRHPKPPGNYWP